MVLVAFTGQAKLGETPNQTQQRYGAALKSKTNDQQVVSNYRFKDYLIEVRFVDGKSAREMFQKATEPKDMTADEAVAFAQIATSKTNWALVGNRAFGSNGGGILVYESGTDRMVFTAAASLYQADIQTKEWKDFEEIQAAADAAAKKNNILNQFQPTAADPPNRTLSTPRQQSPSVTVHITRTGGKYHLAGCRYLSGSDIAVTLDEARSRGLTPCSVCRP